MHRVMIVGPCGSGKSTLSFELARRLRLPLIHMDQLNWQPGWVESPDDVLLARVEEAASGERWIIEGNYGGTMAPRLARADTVIYLDYPVPLCFWRMLKRVWHYRGQVRPDMTEGCPERFDLEFMWYLANWSRGPRQRTEAKLRGQEAKVIRLRHPKALEAWLDRIPLAGAS
ncbi:topology modulation protein [Erythrobacter sp. SDW2]|uniref:topology modulation protein n=1 Tax=Erythrobacter sp. SDW2 TaxID=2907154 RepID=UPI001F1DDB82|nr:topology modulation protein [Erythrobacter sp. SDW2]UIP05831.1 topology modulation protein [Erythrobacter sp. SDW2]